MSTAPQRLSVADYLQIEKDSGERHQFYRGEVFLMSGGTPKHNAICNNVGAALTNALREKPCQIFNSDQKVRVPADGLCTYPDVTVACDELQLDDEVPNAINNPTIIVEVLSDSTAGYDRVGKFQSYRQISSLRQYILIHQDKQVVEWYVRSGDHWELREASEGEVPILIKGGSLKMTVEDIYLKTERL